MRNDGAGPDLLAAAVAAAHPTSPAQLSDTVRVLASDPFDGRAPGTPGEARTIDYLVGRLRALGLEPAGPNGSWTQPAATVRTQLGEGTISTTKRITSGELLMLRNGL